MQVTIYILDFILREMETYYGILSRTVAEVRFVFQTHGGYSVENGPIRNLLHSLGMMQLQPRQDWQKWQRRVNGPEKYLKGTIDTMLDWFLRIRRHGKDYSEKRITVREKTRSGQMVTLSSELGKKNGLIQGQDASILHMCLMEP